MKVSAGWVAAYEFACHSAACRPPTAGGTGGSSKGGGVTQSKEYKQMKAREAMQKRLAQTNAYRRAQGWNELEA